MDNDKLQTKTENQEIKTRKSKICKSIQRTLSTAKYESIVIKESIEEEIEWTSVEDRQKKEQNWTTVLVTSFKETMKSVLEELKLHEIKAHFVDHLETDDRPVPEIQQPKHDVSELDNLDSLS